MPKKVLSAQQSVGAHSHVRSDQRFRQFKRAIIFLNISSAREVAGIASHVIFRANRAFFHVILTKLSHHIRAGFYNSIPHLGDLPLDAVNNAAAKGMVTAMVKAELSPKTIDSCFGVVKVMVASAVDEQGEQIHPRKWNPDFIDLPLVDKSKQNTPCFSSSVMTALAGRKHERERVLFVLCGAAGLRIGEALGLEIDKHFSQDFTTLSIRQKIRNCQVEGRVKTGSARREIDLHPEIAALLRTYAADRKTGFLFCSRNGKPIATSNILKRHLHPALKGAGYLNSSTGNYKAGSHAFRRFRNTHLRNRTTCPEGIRQFWMGHAGETMSDLYDKIREDAAFRRETAERRGFGFELFPVVPNVPKLEAVSRPAKAA